MARLREQHVEATRQALLAAARRRFGTVGFAGTSLDEVAADAGVTKGALYHHFRSKEHLFLEVYDELEEELSARGTEAASSGTDSVDALRRGFAAFLDLALDPAVRRIALLDAPSVLGWEAWREAGAQHRFGLLAAGLQWAMLAGEIDDQPAAPLAHVLLGALHEGALFIAGAEDREAARRDVGQILDRLLAGLRLS